MNNEDLSAKVFEDFLSFLYTGEVSENVNTMDLFAIATKLKVDRLKVISIKEMPKKFSTSLSNTNQRN